MKPEEYPSETFYKNTNIVTGVLENFERMNTRSGSLKSYLRKKEWSVEVETPVYAFLWEPALLASEALSSFLIERTPMTSNGFSFQKKRKKRQQTLSPRIFLEDYVVCLFFWQEVRKSVWNGCFELNMNCPSSSFSVQLGGGVLQVTSDPNRMLNDGAFHRLTILRYAP